MKLFAEGHFNNQQRYKFKGCYAFKIINETKTTENSNQATKEVITENSQFTKEPKQATSFPFSAEEVKYSTNESPVSVIVKNDSLALAENNFSQGSNASIQTAHSSTISNDQIHLTEFTGNMPGTSNLASKLKRPKLLKLHLRSLKQRKSVYNIGRWSEEEHRRFIEAILKFGNDWKNVQRHIRTRSSTQSRSHSQKFFLKIKNYDLFDFKDRKPCINSLNELAKNLDEKQIEKMTDLLISYEYQEAPERKQNPDRMLLRKRKRDIFSFDFDGGDNDSYMINSRSNGQFQYCPGLISRQGRQSFSLLNSSRLGYSSFDSQSNQKSTDNNQCSTVNDDFKYHFHNAFSQKNNRRLSFEDNILLLFSNAIMQQETSNSSKLNKNKKGMHSLSIDHKQDSNDSSMSKTISIGESDYSEETFEEETGESENSWVDTIIDYTQNYVMIK